MPDPPSVDGGQTVVGPPFPAPVDVGRGVTPASLAAVRPVAAAGAPEGAARPAAESTTKTEVAR